VVRGRAGEGFTVEASDAGTFCVVGRTSAAKGRVRVHFVGTKLLDPADVELDVDAGKEAKTRALLRFDAPPESVDLDRDAFAVTATLRIDRSDTMRALAGAKREGLPLTLEDERGQRLAEAVTGGDGRARFDVKTSALGPPGAGELTVRFAGNDALAAASLTQPIARRAEARLSVAKPPAPADPDDGAAIDVTVKTARGPVDGGVVEALYGVESVGAAPVRGGSAHVVAAFPPRAGSPMHVRLRFVPASPYTKPGPEAAVDVAFAAPSPLRQIGLAVLVAALAAWVVAGWRRAPKQAAPEREQPAPPPGRAGVAVLSTAPGFSGWRGTVTDAHDGAPIPHATLRIVAPTFQGDGVLAEVEADDAGAFRLEGAPSEGARLVVESELHASHEQALPPPSVLGIALVTRRRALLDRLVRWARRQGAPFDMVPEPTPGHVRRAAARNDAAAVAEWAAKVEHAAYGPEPVGPAAEHDVRAREPNAARAE
ncbi:MAG TPA: carboxypeptidase-like regulatory domain-containing protein, partial [Minicystis sp.]|nr:carboxypeptidase-like regulatory domain-containing protein [Minicystis sp.]